MSSEDREKSASRLGQVSEEAIFKVTKEIVVKFIEVGRLTPANFAETYARVFETVRRSVRPE
ncbi:MAG TPA: hypothetical protein DDY20_03200 [Desulfobulbaceae bacterium]|nr:hypothetical protein [Desulfobulbaceae bacterium]